MAAAATSALIEEGKVFGFLKTAKAAALSAVDYEAPSSSQDYCKALLNYREAIKHLNLVLQSDHPSVTGEFKCMVKTQINQYAKRRDLLAAKGWCPPDWDNTNNDTADADEWFNTVWHRHTVSARGKISYAVRQIRNFGNLERRILEFNVFAKEIYILKDGREYRKFAFSDLKAVAIEECGHDCRDLPDATFGAAVMMTRKYRFILADMEELNSLIKLFERILQNTHMTPATMKERVEHIVLHAGPAEVCCKNKNLSYAGGNSNWLKSRPYWITAGRKFISVFENREAFVKKSSPVMAFSIKEVQMDAVIRQVEEARLEDDSDGVDIAIDRFSFRFARFEDAEDWGAVLTRCTSLTTKDESRLLDLRNMGLTAVKSDIQALDRVCKANCRSDGAMKLLTKLWNTVYPGIDCPDMASKGGALDATQRSWSRNFGFVHTDPRVSLEGTELSGCGLLPAHALLYYASAAPDAFRKLLITATKTKPRFRVGSSMIEICDQLLMLTGLSRGAAGPVRDRAPHLAYLQLSSLRAKVARMSKKFKIMSRRPVFSMCPQFFLQLCCEALCKAARNFARFKLEDSHKSPRSRKNNDSDDAVARVMNEVNSVLRQHPITLPILQGLDHSKSLS